ncbi:MAG: hypothetical protein DRP64_16385, partial [Verrucomicrobia bacterium]
MTRSQGVNQLYINLFGRPAEPAGLEYWVNGEGSSVNFDQLVLALIDGAFPEDRLVLDNRDTVAIAYTDSDYGSAEPFDIESARIIHTVDGTPESVVAAIDAIDGGSIPVDGDGETFDLTLDTDIITGTDGDDTINSIPLQDNNGNLQDTLQSVDILDGGEGVDTFDVTLSNSNTAPKITNVENVNVRVTTNASQLDLGAASSVESVVVHDSTQFAWIANVGAATLAVENQTQNVKFSGSTAPGISLSVDSVSGPVPALDQVLDVTIDSNLPGGASSLALNTTSSMVNVSSNSYMAATVNATGSNIVGLGGSQNTLGTLAVTGEGSVAFDNAFSAVKTFTAEDGGVTVKLTNNTPGNTAGGLVATTGAGEDDLTVRGGNVKTVSVGAGDDAVTTTGDPVLNAELGAAFGEWNDAKQDLGDAEDAEDAAQQALNAANAALVAANQAVDDAVAAAADTQAAKDAAQAANNADNVTLDAAQVVQDTTQAAEDAAQATRDAAEVTRDNAQADVDAAVIADDAADALVVITTADAAAALVTRNDAQIVRDDAVDLRDDRNDLNNAVQIAVTQLENDTATLDAFSAGAITDLERLQINNAYANGLLTDIPTAQNDAAAITQPLLNQSQLAVNEANAAVTQANLDLADANQAATDAVAAAVVTQDALDAANATLVTAEDDLVAAEAALAIATTNNNNAIAVVDAATATEAQSAQVLLDATAADDAADALVVTTTAAAAAALVTRNAAEVTLDDASQAVDDAQDVVDASYDDLVDAFDAAQTTGALGATSITDLGAGDDVLTLSNGFAEGAAIDAGDGADTLAIGEMEFTEVDGYAAAALAVVTGFETLAITDALQSTTYDVSTISGVTNFVAQESVAGGSFANVTNLGPDSRVTLSGDRWTNDGGISLSLAADTASDMLNVVLNPVYFGAHNGTVYWGGSNLVAQEVETLNFHSTSTDVNAAPGGVADQFNNWINLTAEKLVTLNVTGDAGFWAESHAAQTKLTTVDASANTGGLWFDGQQTDALKGSGLTITGSATAS